MTGRKGYDVEREKERESEGYNNRTTTNDWNNINTNEPSWIASWISR